MRRIIFCLSFFLLFGISTVSARDCFDYSDAEGIIREKCENKWPDNYRMQKHCVDTQWESVDNLEQGNSYNIPENVFDRLREKCCNKWSDNFRMRVHCEKTQSESYTSLETENSTSIPQDIMEKIKNKCESKWPDNFRMQKHCIDTQTEAWQSLNQ